MRSRRRVDRPAAGKVRHAEACGERRLSRARARSSTARSERRARAGRREAARCRRRSARGHRCWRRDRDARARGGAAPPASDDRRGAGARHPAGRSVERARGGDARRRGARRRDGRDPTRRASRGTDHDHRDRGSSVGDRHHDRGSNAGDHRRDRAAIHRRRDAVSRPCRLFRTRGHVPARRAAMPPRSRAWRRGRVRAAGNDRVSYVSPPDRGPRHRGSPNERACAVPEREANRACRQVALAPSVASSAAYPARGTCPLERRRDRPPMRTRVVPHTRETGRLARRP